MTDQPPVSPMLPRPPELQQEATNPGVTPVSTPARKIPSVPVLIIVSWLLIAVVAAVGGWYVGMKGWFGRQSVKIPVVPAASVSPSPIASAAPTEPGDGVACTMDALLCPDGSYVGRTGPNCEFVCPVAEPVPGVIEPAGPVIQFDTSTGGQSPGMSNPNDPIRSP